MEGSILNPAFVEITHGCVVHVHTDLGHDSGDDLFLDSSNFMMAHHLLFHYLEGNPDREKLLHLSLYALYEKAFENFTPYFDISLEYYLYSIEDLCFRLINEGDLEDYASSLFMSFALEYALYKNGMSIDRILELRNIIIEYR